MATKRLWGLSKENVSTLKAITCFLPHTCVDMTCLRGYLCESESAGHRHHREKWKKKARKDCLSVCCFLKLSIWSHVICEWRQRLTSGQEVSLFLPSSLWWICPSFSERSWALFNGLFQPWFARQKPLTNPFKGGSMDFMAPRALSPSFNKVKSKALSIRQWAREQWMQQFLIPKMPLSTVCLTVPW